MKSFEYSCAVVSIIFPIFATLSVIARFCTRGKLKNGRGLDDWLILPSLLFYYAYAADVLIGIFVYAGLETFPDLQTQFDSLQVYLKTLYLLPPSYGIAMSLAKFSIIAFYRRVFNVGSFPRISAFVGLVALGGIFLLGGFVIVTEIIRISVTYKPGRALISFTGGSLWTSVQIGVGIICPCLPTYPAFWVPIKKLLNSIQNIYTTFRQSSSASREATKKSNTPECGNGIPGTNSYYKRMDNSNGDHIHLTEVTSPDFGTNSHPKDGRVSHGINPTLYKFDLSSWIWESKDDIGNLLVVIRESVREASQTTTISQQQIGSLKSPASKGKIWVAKSSLLPSPEDQARQSLLGVIDKFNEQNVPYFRPLSTKIDLEWVGFRKGVVKDTPEPKISEKEKYRGLLEDSPGPGVVMILYGGAFYMNTQASYRKIAAQLSETTGLPCVTVHQRLSPQNSFPTALLDVFNGYMALLSPPPGSPHDRITCMCPPFQPCFSFLPNVVTGDMSACPFPNITPGSNPSMSSPQSARMAY
ncbi:hypothetical protein HYALB_00011978 [Hymenoscyphus albidus]|uniref:Uncharacterized protein n=1 Tax=Hymenoscyphus albidus TaxID=595503 RepID=A0A9N9PT89_9HELO|nr:hypothetical protein HYALB_00011978 [Hymenoscyphus albidus]